MISYGGAFGSGRSGKLGLGCFSRHEKLQGSFRKREKWEEATGQSGEILVGMKSNGGAFREQEKRGEAAGWNGEVSVGMKS